MRKIYFLLIAFLLLFNPNAIFSQEVIIGKDSISLDGFIRATDYSYTQIIYKQKWIHAEGLINKIAFQVENTQAPSMEVAIYMGHTSRDEFEPGMFREDWIPFNEIELVYEGTLNFSETTGWFEIELQTPFTYNNQDNLVIAIDKNSIDENNISFFGSIIDYDQSFTGVAGSDVDPSDLPHTNNPSLSVPNLKLIGSLTNTPYLYFYNPKSSITTTTDSSVIFQVETNQASFEGSCDQSWLSLTTDVLNKEITATVDGSNGNISEWERKAAITISSNGTVYDTTLLSQNRFESVELELNGYYFADFDNDNDLDVLGSGIDKIRNDGNDIFSILTNADYNNDYIAYWADYDNDGDLDFLCKADSSKIYRNDGSNNFFDIKVFITQLKCDQYENISTPWCDFDNDGDLDLFLSGLNIYEEPEVHLYENRGDDVFFRIEANIKAVTKGTIEWTDFDNDGYSDIMMAGSDINGSPSVSLFKNEGNKRFTEIETTFPKLFNGKFSWGDYDADGDYDVIICGSIVINEHRNLFGETKIFRNDGEGNFTNIEADLDVFHECNSTWMDYDNDGDLDVIIYGYEDKYLSIPNLVFYENLGEDNFSESYKKELYFSESFPVSFTLGNYDNDGDIDFLLKTKIWDDYCQLYRNNYNNLNEKPIAPDNFDVRREGTKTILLWNSGFDKETPSKALKYNIRIGSAPGASDIIKPYADESTGFIQIPNLINCKDTFRILENLPIGTYYFSIQSIDNMYAGSPFSSEQSFEIKEVFSELPMDVPLLNPASIVSGDYDNDGDYDFIISGSTYEWTGRYTKIFTNMGDSTFSESLIDLMQLDGLVNWGDYDNDNDLDIIINGYDENDAYKTVIYRNDGNDIFADIGFSVNEDLGLVNWVDTDNDGDLDIVTAYQIYLNNGNDSFEISTNFNHNQWIGSRGNGVAIGDYDNDMDVDIVIAARKSILFENSNGIFSETNDKLYDVERGIIKWFDYNNDNYLDILQTGLDTAHAIQTIIYQNENGKDFIEINNDIRAIDPGGVICGDYNKDGKSDILIAGLSDKYIFKVYENSGSNGFTEVYNQFTLESGHHSIAWIDYNNDGHLDVLSNYDVLYSNNSVNEVLQAKAPINLQIQISGFNVQFSWDYLVENKYSYNLRVGTTPGGTEIVSPMADVVTGKRLILELGNVQLNTSWIIKNLTPGEIYYWSVQAIDNSFVGGAWAEEQSFIVNVVWADFLADTVCLGDTTHFTDASLFGANEINSWKWYFGDGDSAMVQNPQHLYTLSGYYPVTLIVSDGEFTGSITKTVIVKSKPIANFQVDAVCYGDPTVFVNQTDEQGLTISSWNWIFGDNQVSNQQNPDPHYYAQPGEYNVQLSVASDNGCVDTISKIAVVAQYPVVIVTANGPVEFCEGDNVTLSVEENENYIYQWKFDDVPLNDSTNYSCNAIYKGTYTIDVENSLAGCLSNSLPVNVNVVEKPIKPIVNTQGFHEDNCPGNELITLEVKDATTLYQYQWKKNGIPLENGESSTYKEYLEEGNYIVDVANGDCKSTSDEVAVFFTKVLPEKPEIIAKGPNVWYLACTNDQAEQYQWYYNNELLSGATEYLYVANQNLGTYNVRIAEANGCFVSSDAVTIPLTATGVNDLDPFTNLKIYPNPTLGVFTIEMDNQIYGELITRIFSQNAVEILNIKFDKSTNHFKARVDLSGQGTGVYVISFNLDKYKAERKLIVK